MARILLCGIVALAFPTDCATAADMPPPPPAVVKAAPPGWAGGYVGVNGGYGWSDRSVHAAGDGIGEAGTALLGVVFGTGPSSLPLNAKGFVGGAQIGYNWQFARYLMAGIEVDAQYSRIEGDATATATTVALFRLNAKTELIWFGTMRGRMGVAFDRLLLFGTGGLAYGATKASARVANDTVGSTVVFTGPNTSLTCLPSAVCIAGAESKTSLGWAAGGGAEWLLWQGVTFKAEYLHVDLGDQAIRLIAQIPSSGNGSVTTTIGAFDIVRAGVNVQF
jgi:outer membrane immunogenic protein